MKKPFEVRREPCLERVAGEAMSSGNSQGSLNPEVMMEGLGRAEWKGGRETVALSVSGIEERSDDLGILTSVAISPCL